MKSLIIKVFIFLHIIACSSDQSSEPSPPPEQRGNSKDGTALEYIEEANKSKNYGDSDASEKSAEPVMVTAAFLTCEKHLENELVLHCIFKDDFEGINEQEEIDNVKIVDEEGHDIDFTYSINEGLVTIILDEAPASDVAVVVSDSSRETPVIESSPPEPIVEHSKEELRHEEAAIDCSRLKNGSWVKVKANPQYKNQDFCIMKYEAVEIDGMAYSAPDGGHLKLSQLDAITKCAELGPNYHLISNLEWMTAATNILNIGSNWTGGQVGSGILIRGHTNRVPHTACPASDDDTKHFVKEDCEMQVTGDDLTQKRTHTLASGDIIWDLGGNRIEWTSKFNSFDKPSPHETPETPHVNFEFLDIEDTESMPITDLIPSLVIENEWTSEQGIGTYQPGYPDAGGGLLRGGRWFGGWPSRLQSGLFHASLKIDPTSHGHSTNIAFRCAADPSHSE